MTIVLTEYILELNRTGEPEGASLLVLYIMLNHPPPHREYLRSSNHSDPENYHISTIHLLSERDQNSSSKLPPIPATFIT